MGGVVVENERDRRARRQSHELERFCDVFPVVDEDGLESVGQEDADGRAGVEGFFLLEC